ncbi:MAG: sulfurtransferase TusA family protein [Chloroflexi bacterium]|nr:sulfurtransferase TusA family protein [Chloroflexota bacterium]
MTAAVTPNQTLDCRGATYPVPILKAKRALDTMHAGEILQVLATDKNTKPDLQVWAAKANVELLSVQDADDGSFSFIVRKK